MRLLFQNKTFRLFWIAGLFIDLGLITGEVIGGWLALDVSNSAFWVGATAGIGGLAMTLFAPIGGVFVDRFGRRKLILMGLFIRFAIATGLGTLILTGNIRLWHVMGASFGDGLAVSFMIPALMALTLDIAGRENMLSATAARFGGMAVVGIIAPLSAGIIVNTIGISWAFAMVASSCLVSSMVMLYLPMTRPTTEKISTPFEDLKQGISYVTRTPIVRTMMIMIIVTEVFGWAHEIMMPVMARDVLDVGAAGLGYLLAAGSVGATVTTVIVSNMRDFERKSDLLIGGCMGFGIFLILFSWSEWFIVSLCLIAAAHACVILYETTINTLLQTSVPDELRGRVLGFQTTMWGLTGLSGFHTGAIARLMGAPVAITIGGSVVILNTLRLFRKRNQFDIAAEVHEEGESSIIDHGNRLDK